MELAANQKKVLSVIGLAVAFLLGFFIRVGMQAAEVRKADYALSEETYEVAKEKYVKPIMVKPENGSENIENIEIPWDYKYEIDFYSIREDYPDVAGWIDCDNSQISYPIMYSGDNEKYIRTTYTGQKATAGSIFMEGENHRDFSDYITVIYGHDMRNLSMFGTLKYYRSKKNYYDDHQYFTLYTQKGKERYKIFAFLDVREDSMLYNLDYSDEEAGYEYLSDVVMPNNLLKTNINITQDDKIVVLSTCTAQDDRRFIVCAVRVSEE